MRQSWFVVFGVIVVLVPAAFAALFGWRALLEQPAMGLFALAGGLGMLGARVAAVEVGSVRISWRHLVGGSFLLLALGIVVQSGPQVLAGTESTVEFMMTGWAVAMSCFTGFIGFDIARDGPHHDITSNVDRVLAL